MAEVDVTNKPTQFQTCLNECRILCGTSSTVRVLYTKYQAMVDVAVSDEPTISKQIYLSIGFYGTPLLG
jgi:hypothetical protein